MNKSKKYTNKKLKKFRKTKRGGSWFSRIFGTSNSAKPNATLTQTPTLNATLATPKLNAKPNPRLSPTTPNATLATPKLNAKPNPTLSPTKPISTLQSQPTKPNPNKF